VSAKTQLIGIMKAKQKILILKIQKPEQSQSFSVSEEHSI
jgi:hypothetical protein